MTSDLQSVMGLCEPQTQAFHSGFCVTGLATPIQNGESSETNEILGYMSLSKAVRQLTPKLVLGHHYAKVPLSFSYQVVKILSQEVYSTEVQ